MNHLNWLEKLTGEERSILLHAALLPEVISLDTLTVTTQSGAIKTLQLLERLVEDGILKMNNQLGRGFYQFVNDHFADLVLEKTDQTQLRDSAEKLINFVKMNVENDLERYRDLAHLYQVASLQGKTDLPVHCQHNLTRTTLNADPHDASCRNNHWS